METKRRVLYCESNTDGTIGGSHYCLLNLVENLSKVEFDPVVVFYENHALVDRFRAAAETIVLDRPSPVQWGARSRGLLSVPTSIVRRAVNLVKFGGSLAWCVGFLKSRQVALVHLNNSITRHHEWIMAARIAGVPCIVHERGLPKYGWSDRLLASRLALIIPMSKWIADHMVRGRVSQHNIRVFYDGLDPKRFEPGTGEAELRAKWGVSPTQPVVGIVGNVRHWKGQETVVRALIEVVKRYPDVVCFFVGAATEGDLDYEARLKALIGEARIEANVRFAGYQRDVAGFVSMMRFVIHASVVPEPFGMVVLEAMARRKAVIGARAGGVIEMVVEGQTGYTFPPGDSAQLALRMVELLGDPTLAERMGEAGLERLQRDFTLERYMSQIHEAYCTAMTMDASWRGADAKSAGELAAKAK